MKFNLISLFLLIALVGVSLAWFLDHQSTHQKLTQVQADAAQNDHGLVLNERTRSVVSLAKDFAGSSNPSAFASGMETQLLSELNQLYSYKDDFDSVSKETGKSSGEMAGEILFYLGWQFESEDELVKQLVAKNGIPGEYGNSVEFKSFLKSAIEKTSRLESEFGSLYDRGIQKWVAE